MVLDYLKGGSLKDVVLQLNKKAGFWRLPCPCPSRGSQSVHCRYYRQDERGLKEAWIREVIQQSAGGLAYCHALRLIHKDLKDENIMLLQMLGCIVGGVQLKGPWSLLFVSGSQPTGRSLMCLGT